MVSGWLFRRIHLNNLVYNQCWEDPSLDHEVLNIQPSDRIVMITSAGCNALDYLTRNPVRIDAIDVNPSQTALLELKLAALERLEYRDFFEMFGRGKIYNHRPLYERKLRPLLSKHSQTIWDRKIDYFNLYGRGLYFCGTAGTFARMFHRFVLRNAALRRDLDDFQRIGSLDEQAVFYRKRIAPAIWTPTVRLFLRTSIVLSLLGVPMAQIRQLERTTGAGIAVYIERRIERMFTSMPIQQNYFWRLYMNGSYTRDCCPEYLMQCNFETLRSRSHRIKPHTMTLTQFLMTYHGRYQVFVLLDHMDWLVSTPAVLREEWRWILATAAPGARIIYRSGGTSFNHIPQFAAQRLRFDLQRTAELNDRDRVGTYGSFHFATVTE